MAKKVPSSAAVKEYFRVNGPNWYNDISYGLNTIKNYAGNVYVSLQANNLNHLPDEVDSLWWATISGGKGASIVRAPVAENVLKGDLLAWNTSGQFVKADNTNALKVNIAGFALSNALTGANVDAQKIAILKNAFSSLTPGSRYYMSVAGGITATPPTSGYKQAVGTAISATDMDIHFQEPEFLIYKPNFDIKVTAAESISSLKAVALDGTGQAILASRNLNSKVPVVGIARSTVGVGTQFNLAVNGEELTGFSGLTPGQPVYLGTNGNITHDTTFNVGEFRQHLGIAKTATSIVILIGEPVIISVASTDVKDGVGIEVSWPAIGAIPNGWLECNGQAVSRATYSDLFSVLGVLYGVGDGSTTFNLPDRRGIILKGNGSSNKYRENFDAMRFTGDPIDIASTATSTITTATNHGLSVGDMIFLYGGASNSSSDHLGLGFVISTPAGNTLTVSATRNGAAYASYTNSGLIKIAKVSETILPATTVYSGNNITIPTHGLSTGDIVMYPTQTIATPTGVTAFRQYRVTVVDANVFTITDLTTSALVTISGTVGGIFRKLNNNPGDWQLDSVQGHVHNVTNTYGGTLNVSTSGGFQGLINGSNINSSTPISDGIDGAPRTSSETRPFTLSTRYIIRYAPFQMMTISSGSGSGGPATNVGITFANGQFETDLTGWNTYADTAQSSPVDGTGGASGLVRSLQTPSNLFGTNSLLITKGASNLQGNGVSYDFSIDKGMTQKTIDFSFSYIASANYASGDIGMYIYDITNGAVINVSNRDILSTSGGIGTHRFFFTPSNSLLYRLVFHVQTVSALAYTLEVDNVQPSEYKAVIGAGISEEYSWVPTTQGLGTPTISYAKWRQVGSKLRAFITLTSGTVTASEVQIGLPNNYTTMADYPALQVVGHYTQGTSGANAGQVLAEASKSYVTLGLQSGTQAGAVKLVGTNLSNSAVYTFEFEVAVSQLFGKNTVQIAESIGPLYLSNAENVVNTNGVVAKSYYGVDGSPILSNTSATFYDVTLPRALQPNEKYFLEVRSKIDGEWIEADKASIRSIWVGSLSYAFTGATNHVSKGIHLEKSVSGQIRVVFSVNLDGGSSSYDSSSTSRAWSAVTGASDGFDRWRVRVGPQNAVELPPTQIASYSIASFNYASANVTTCKPTTVELNTVGSNFNTTTGQFTCTHNGALKISYNCQNIGGGSHTVAVYKNGVASYLRLSIVNGYSGSLQGMIKCQVGDIFDIRSDVSIADGSVLLTFEVIRNV